MYKKSQCLSCVCAKCKYQWTTKDETVPKICAKCKTAKWNADYVEVSLPQKSLADHVRDLSTADRLKLFEHFELCCGMNRGDCICPDEPMRMTETVNVSPSLGNIGANPAMARFLSNLQTKPAETQETPKEWQFSKKPVHYPDNGNAYREQGMMLPSGKWTFRQVRVDYDDVDRVIEVVTGF
jgi:hypothetical protein